MVEVLKEGLPELIHEVFEQVSYGDNNRGAFQEEITVGAKALRKEDTWHIQKTIKRNHCGWSMIREERVT